MSKRKLQILTEAQIEDLVDLELGDNEPSDGEIDHLSISDHDSETEVEYESDLAEEVEDDEDVPSSSGVCSSSQTLKTNAANIIRFTSGPKINANDCEVTEKLFGKFINESMIKMIVHFTNIEISVKRQKYEKEVSFIFDTNEEEIKVFIGLLLLAGVYRSAHENVQDLWSTDGSGREIFRAVMPKRRFQFLISAIRFDDRRDRDKNDKFSTFRDMFEFFTDNCRKNYVLSENVTIDEMLRGFSGRCGFRQYMPKKPAKYGLKIFIICDSANSYMYNAEVYLGKQPNQPRNANLGQNIVERLTTSLRHSGRNITCDNWFTSFGLADNLFSRKLTIVGTIKSNKKEIPKSFTNPKNREVLTFNFLQI